EPAFLSGEFPLDASVEEIRDVRVLLRFGEAEVRDAVLRPRLRQDSPQDERGKRHRERKLLLVTGEAHEMNRGEPDPVKFGEMLLRQRPTELERAIGPKVDRDRR